MCMHSYLTKNRPLLPALVMQTTNCPLAPNIAVRVTPVEGVLIVQVESSGKRSLWGVVLEPVLICADEHAPLSLQMKMR
eukprot:COSAG05_NODE_7514_length_802_cov_1.354196_1_plen_79_part_00